MIEKHEYQRQGAIFVDLDHTLIKPKIGKGRNKAFPTTPDDYIIDPSIAELLSFIQHSRQFSKIIIVSNQGGIAYKTITKEFFEERINLVLEELERDYGIIRNIDIDYLYAPNYDWNRKPYPGMALTAAQLYNIFLPNSVMIGDQHSDKLFAINSGMSNYYHPAELANLYKTNKEQAIYEIFKQLHGPQPERKSSLNDIDYVSETH